MSSYTDPCHDSKAYCFSAYEYGHNSESVDNACLQQDTADHYSQACLDMAAIPIDPELFKITSGYTMLPGSTQELSQDVLGMEDNYTAYTNNFDPESGNHNFVQHDRGNQCFQGSSDWAANPMDLELMNPAHQYTVVPDAMQQLSQDLLGIENNYTAQTTTYNPESGNHAHLQHDMNGQLFQGSLHLAALPIDPELIYPSFENSVLPEQPSQYFHGVEGSHGATGYRYLPQNIECTYLQHDLEAQYPQTSLDMATIPMDPEILNTGLGYTMLPALTEQPSYGPHVEISSAERVNPVCFQQDMDVPYSGEHFNLMTIPDCSTFLNATDGNTKLAWPAGQPSQDATPMQVSGMPDQGTQNHTWNLQEYPQSVFQSDPEFLAESFPEQKASEPNELSHHCKMSRQNIPQTQTSTHVQEFFPSSDTYQVTTSGTKRSLESYISAARKKVKQDRVKVAVATENDTDSEDCVPCGQQPKDHLEDFIWPANQIKHEVMSARDPVELESMDVSSISLLPDTKEFGILRNNSRTSSKFTMQHCAYQMLGTKVTGGKTGPFCQNPPVYAYGTMYRPEISHPLCPVKLEQVVACCKEHTGHMSDLNLYPIPVCQGRICRSGNGTKTKLGRHSHSDRSPEARKDNSCTWLATYDTGGHGYLNSCVTRPRARKSSLHSNEPDKPKQNRKWSEYDPARFSTLKKAITGPCQTKVKFAADNLVYFEPSRATDPNVKYHVDAKDGSITFWVEDSTCIEATMPATQCTTQGQLMMRIHKYTSKTNQVVLHSITSTFSSMASISTLEQPSDSGEPTETIYHTIHECRRRECEMAALHVLQNAAVCSHHYRDYLEGDRVPQQKRKHKQKLRQFQDNKDITSSADQQDADKSISVTH